MSDRCQIEEEAFVREVSADIDAVVETEYLMGIPGYRESVAEALREGEECAVLCSDLDW